MTSTALKIRRPGTDGGLDFLPEATCRSLPTDDDSWLPGPIRDLGRRLPFAPAMLTAQEIHAPPLADIAKGRPERYIMEIWVPDGFVNFIVNQCIPFNPT